MVNPESSLVTTAEITNRLEPEVQIEEPGRNGPLDLYQQFTEALIRSGKLRENELSRARRFAAQADDEPLSTLLVKLGMVSEKDVAEILSEVGGFFLTRTNDYPEVSPLAEKVSLRFLKQHKIVGIDDREDSVVLAMADPLNTYTIDAMSLACGKPVLPWVGIASEIESAIEKQMGAGKSQMDQLVDSLGGDREIDEDDVEHLKDLASEAPVIRMVNLIFQQALETKASDIHV